MKIRHIRQFILSYMPLIARYGVFFMAWGILVVLPRPAAAQFWDEYTADGDACTLAETMEACDTRVLGEEFWNSPNFVATSTQYNTSPHGILSTNGIWDIDAFADNYNASSSIITYAAVMYFQDIDAYATTYDKIGLTGFNYRWKWDGSDEFDLYNHDGTIMLAENAVNGNDWFLIAGKIDCETATYDFHMTGALVDYSVTDEPLSAACGADIQANFFYNYPGDPYIDDMTIRVFGTSEEYDIYNQDNFTWYFPQDSCTIEPGCVNGKYVINNSGWSQFQLMYDSTNYSFDPEDDLVAAVYYTDNSGTWTDYETGLATTTGPTVWQVTRTHDLADGAVSAWAVLFKTDHAGCSEEWTCLRTDLAVAPLITFIASSTGYDIRDYGLTGYTAATSTEEYGFLINIIKPGLDNWGAKLGKFFPFSIGWHIYDCWNDATNYAFTEDYEWLDTVATSGDITFEVMPSWGASGQAINVSIGSSTYGAIGQSMNSINSIYAWIRRASTAFLYGIFLLYIIIRAYRAYNSWANTSHPDV